MKRQAAGTAPRRVVLDLLLGRGAFPTRRFAAAADRGGLDGRDRALARELLSGVIRRRRTLDAILRAYSDRRALEPAVLWTLRLGLYQRFFLEHVPPYAAVDATLEAARPLLRRAVGFANAVLRAAGRGARRVAAPRKPSTARERLDLPGASWLFDRPILPDPEADLAAHLAVAWSYPDVLVRRWLAAAGSDRTLARLRALDSPPALALRVNPLRATRAQVRAAVAAAGHAVEDGPLPLSLVLRRPAGDVRAVPGFAEGWWSVQDLAAQELLALAAPAPGERILDLCAAPGGKSFGALELAGGATEVVACDVDGERLAVMRRDAERLHHPVRAVRIGPGGAGMPEGEWDLVLLDVPCTNTGVLGRRPEARWRFGAAELRRCVERQRSIVEWALPAVLRPRTRVLWSTCSLEPEENQDGAARAGARGGLGIAAERLVEPDDLRSGGYAALLCPT